MLESLLQDAGWLTLLAGLLLPAVGVPLPEELMFVAGGIMARRGMLSPPAALLVCWLGAIGTDLCIFMLARAARAGAAALAGGRAQWLERWHLEARVARRGGIMILLARPVSGLRLAVFALAGAQKMHPLRFLLWDAVAVLPSMCALGTVGYLLGEAPAWLEPALGVLRTIGLVALGGLAVAGATFAIVRWRRARHSGVPD